MLGVTRVRISRRRGVRSCEKGALRGGFHVYRRLVRDMGVEQRVVTLTIVEEVLVMWRDGSVG